ncbi:beta strand repeat-containing protein [Tepidimonas sp. HKU77]|uniref:beta strand repeat-containing protein n=1 Tax=Tepidimonas sp. HKU77 TaxID=3414503 RepID=UPI003C79DF25
MAMTTQQQTDAYRFFAIAFGAAPGVTYMNQIADAYAAGMTTKQIVNVYTTKPQFTSVYPNFYTNAQFANALIENVVGTSASAAAKAQAKADVEAALNIGWSRGDVIYQIFTNLANKPLTDPDWGNTAKLLANQVAVARYYTEVKLGNTTDLAVLKSVIAGVTPTTDVSTTAALDAVLAGAATGQTFTLTTGTDNLTGTSGNDTFTAGESGGVATLTVGDQINGGAGNDTLNWIQTAAVTGVPTGVTVTSVETVNVTSGAGITLNTTAGFADTTALNTNTSGAAQTITAAATQNLVATVALQGGNNTSFNGGNNVTVNATGVTTGTTTVGGTTAAAGAVVVNAAGTLADGAGATTLTMGQVSVTGGTKVNVDVKGTVTGGSDDANDALTLSAVNVTGNASTTEVSVSQTAAQTRVAGAAGVGRAAIVNGQVTVTDVNAASATAAGTIATVTLNNYGNSTIDSSALTTVNLSGTGGTLGISRGALTATPTANTLNLNVSGLTAGAITDAEAASDDGFTTINLASTGTASTIADLIAADATALNISGDAKVTLTAQTMANVKTITVTNTGGASLGTALANDVLFVGGAGADAISIGATTKAINMGAGNDVVTLSSATLGTGGTLNGGDGKDTLVANTNGSSFIADPAFGGFEVLRVAGAAAQGSHNANGFIELEIGNTAGATTFTNVAAGVGLTVLGNPTGGTTVTLANATGTNDTFNLTLKSASALTAGSVALAGVETVNITSTDTDTTAHTNTLTLVATAAKSVVVTGNAGLNLTNTGNTAITSFDASGVTGAAADAAALAVTFVSANTTVSEAVTIKGGSGNDSLTGSATANDSIFGNDGADTLVYTGGADVFTGGAGADTFDVNAVGTKTAFLTIADAAKADKIDLAGISSGTIANGALGAKVTLGAAATLDQYLDAAAAFDGSTNAVAKWFQFGTDTYIVVSNDNGTTGPSAGFTSGTDAVIKLTGTIDLSTSAFASEVLTIA